MNRAQRRQAQRAQGWAGAKAKRYRPTRVEFTPPAPDPKQVEFQAAMVEHEQRQSARRLGLVVPPTEHEARFLRGQGMPVGSGGLIVPGA